MAERKHKNNGSYLGLGPCRIPLGYGCPGCADPGACNFREHAVDQRGAPRSFPKSQITKEGLARFFEVVLPHMNEVQRRVVAGAAVELLGRGGKSAVASASGLSRNTVTKAETEVTSGAEPSARLRAEGGGDKLLIDKHPGLLETLDELVGPETRAIPCHCCAGHRSPR